MSSRELFNSIKIESVVATRVLTTSATPTVIDMSDASSVNFLVNMGTAADTLSGTVYWTIKLQESLDNITFTDVIDSESLLIAINGVKQKGAISIVVDTIAKSAKIFEICYKVPGVKRYLKLLVNATGTHTNGTPVGVVAMKGNLKISPEAGKANA